MNSWLMVYVIITITILLVFYIKLRWSVPKVNVVLEGTYDDLYDARDWNRYILSPAIRQAQQQGAEVHIYIDKQAIVTRPWLAVALDTRNTKGKLPLIVVDHRSSTAVETMANELLTTYKRNHYV